MCHAAQGAAVLPLVLEAGGRGQRHQEDLIPRHLPRVRVLQAEPPQESDVGPDLELPRAGRLQVGIPHVLLLWRLAAKSVGLVLCPERRPQAGGAVRRPQPQLLHVRDVDVLRNAPRAGDAVVVLIPAGDAEQGRSVPPQQPVEDVAVPNVEGRHEVGVPIPDCLDGRTRAQAGRGREFGNPHDVDGVGRERELAVLLVLDHDRRLGRVAEVPGAEGERAHAREGRAPVERAAVVILFGQIPVRRSAVLIQEPLRLEFRAGRGLLVVVVVGLGREPIGHAPAATDEPGVARALRGDVGVRQEIEGVRRVDEPVRDPGAVRAAVGVLGEQVEVGLDEGHGEEG